MSESYSIPKKERLGIYEMIERVYLSHENRLTTLERMVASLRKDVDRIKMERYRPSIDRTRISDLLGKYYLLASVSSRSFTSEEEKVIFRTIPFEKATTQISRFIMKNPNVSTSDIIFKLKLEPDLVNRVLFHLEKEGKIQGEAV